MSQQPKKPASPKKTEPVPRPRVPNLPSTIGDKSGNRRGNQRPATQQ